MQNIDVRFNATSNFGKVRGDLAALQAQAASLNAAFSKGAYATPPKIVDPAAWRQGGRAIDAASKAYRNAAASSGLLNTQQIRSVSETEKYTRALQKQKLGLRDMIKHQGIMREVYRDQLRMQRMTAQHWGTDTMGRHVTDITMPKNVPTELDNWRRKLGMVGNMAASAGTQITNLGKNIQWSGRQLMTGFTYPMVLFGAAAGAMAFKIEDAFGQINKVYDVSAKAMTNEALKTQELGKLRTDSMAMAEKVAAKYGKTVSNTLAIEQELAATGLKGQKLLDSTTEVSRISALGSIDPSKTTDMVVALQTSFRKTIPDGKTLTNVLNFMNAASNATSLSLDDIAAAVPRAAAALSNLGVTAQEMTILLVSMREAGVDAVSGSNALKSVSARIINPAIIERAQKAFDRFGISSINLQKMVDANQGNIYGFVKDLGKAEQAQKGMTDYQKTQVASILAGGNQYSRFSAVLTNVGDAQNGVNNQTKRAIELQGQSADQLAATAKSSEELAINNPAGKLRQEWAKFQIQLAKFGKPFLSAAAKVLHALGAIGQKFMELPGGVKKTIAIIAVLTAMAGPIIMLVGLFLNLSGWLIKVAGNIAKMIGISKLWTKEEQAAKLTTEAVNRSIMEQTKATSTLAAELRVLVAAYERGAKAAMQYLAANETAAAGVASAAATTAAAAASIPVRPPVGTVVSGVNPGTRTPFVQAGPQQVFNPANMGLGSQARPVTNQAGATADQLQRQAVYSQQVADNQRRGQQAMHDTSRQAMAQRGAYNSMNQSVNGMAVGMGVAGAAMATMMITSNGTAHNIAKWALIATFIVPAVKTLATATWGAVRAGAAYAATQMAAARASLASAGALGRATGALRVAGAGAAGMAGGIARTIGPGGVVVLGALALGAIYKKAWDMGEAASKRAAAVNAEQKRAQESISNSTTAWAESMGKVVKKYESIYHYASSIGEVTPDAASKQEQLIKYYSEPGKDPETGEETAAPVADFKNLSGNDLDFALIKKFIDLQAEAGLSAKDAAAHMRAFYIAMGRSASDADQDAQNLMDTWGSIKSKDFNWTGLVGQQRDLFSGADPDEAAQRGNDLGEAFLAGLANAKDPKVAQGMLDTFVGDSTKNINEVWSNLGAKYGDQWYEFMADNGVTNVKQFAELLRRTTMEELGNLDTNVQKTIDVHVAKLDPKPGEVPYDVVQKQAGYNLPWGEIELELKGVNDEQDNLLSGLDKIMHFGDDVPSLFSLPEYGDIQAQTKSYAEQKDILVGINQTMYNSLGIQSGQANAQQMSMMNAFLYANGLKQATTWAEGLSNFIHKVPADTKKAADEVKKVNALLQSLRGRDLIIKIQTKQVGGILQSGIENVQNSMVDNASYIFDQAQQAEIDKAEDAAQAAQDRLNDSQEAAQRALNDRQDAAQRAQQERQEAATRAFDAKWEKKKDALTKLYDSRVDAIERVSTAEQKADEIRSRLYEKEKKRLSDLAEAANTQIDFDVAINTGNLDEAAKLQNNAEAKGMSDQMDAEQQRMEQQTQNLIDRLDKKKERLEKARDKAMKRLEKVEEKMRRSLEKMQEAQQRALQKQQEAQSRALQKSQEADSRALAAKQEADERASQRSRDLAKQEFDYKMELFKSLPAANKKQLEAALAASGLTLKDFGLNTLNGPKGIAPQWGKFFHDHMVDGMRQAGADIAKDNMWSSVTADIAVKMLKGFGFSGLGQFQNFVKTGKLPAKPKPDSTNHGGGEIGKGSTGRGGIYTSGGLHRTEQMVRAQKGEYVINRKAYAENRELVRGINSGKVSGSAYRASHAANQEKGTRRITEGLGAYPISEFNTPVVNYGVAQMGMGLAAGYQGMLKGTRTSIASNVSAARKRQQAAAARRERQRKARQANQTGPANGPLPMLPSAGDHPGPLAESSLGWAAAHRYGDGLGNWLNRCLSFVRQSLGAPGGVYDATASWTGNKYKRGISNYNDVPAGVPVYWTTGNHGHVILSAGDGMAYGTDNRVPGQALPTSISDVAGWLGTGPVGWSADINGKQVYPLRRGGEIKYDNTLISAHKGETVLPARLTEQFKNNVRNGGGDTYEFTLDFRGATIKEDVDIEKAVYAAIDKKETRQGRRRVVSNGNSR